MTDTNDTEKLTITLGNNGWDSTIKTEDGKYLPVANFTLSSSANEGPPTLEMTLYLYDKKPPIVIQGYFYQSQQQAIREERQPISLADVIRTLGLDVKP